MLMNDVYNVKKRQLKEQLNFSYLMPNSAIIVDDSSREISRKSLSELSSFDAFLRFYFQFNCCL